MKRKNSLQLFFILFIFLLTAFLVINYLLYQTQKKSKAAGETVALSFNPSSVSATSNQEFSTTMTAKPSVDITTRGYYFNVSFDKTKLQVKSIGYKLGAVSSGLGDDNSKLSSINESGLIKIQGEIQAPTGQILLSSQTTDVIQLNFTSTSNDSSTVSIVSTNSKFIKIGADYLQSEISIVGQSLSVNGGIIITSPTSAIPTSKVTSTPTQSVHLLFSPSSVSVSAGKEFSTTVTAKPSVDITTRGYYFNVSFDKTKLQVKSIDYKLGAVSSGLGDDNSKLSSINESGLIKIQGEIQEPSGHGLPSSTITDVIVFVFTTTSKEPSIITINATTSRFTKINPDTSLIELPVTADSLSVNGGTITIVPTPTDQSAKCNEICSQAVNPPISKTCQGGLICWPGPTIILQAPGSVSYCRNPNCSTKENCICPITPTGGPTGKPTGGPTPTPTPTPVVTGIIVTSTPSPYPTGQPVPAPITLSLKLKFQGIMKRPPNQFNNQVVKVTVFGNPIIIYAASSATTPYISSQKVNFVAGDNGVWSGTVTFPNLIPGADYKILIKGPKHIQKKICDKKPTETYPGSYHCGQGKIVLKKGANNLDFSGIYLLVGDLPDQDGIVNSYDVSLVRNSLNKGDTDSLRLADLNLDGVVNAQDYSLVIAALSIRSDEE